MVSGPAVRLKDALISAPILGVPRDEGTYLLDTDASDTGLGAVLSPEARTCCQKRRIADVIGCC